MKSILAAALLLCGAAAAQAAPIAGPGEAGAGAATSRDSSMTRYHQLRRMERRERGRPGFQQGANCVTPKLVCWVPEAGSSGDPCSCVSPSRGTVAGTIEG